MVPHSPAKQHQQFPADSHNKTWNLAHRPKNMEELDNTLDNALLPCLSATTSLTQNSQNILKQRKENEEKAMFKTANSSPITLLCRKWHKLAQTRCTFFAGFRHTLKLFRVMQHTLCLVHLTPNARSKLMQIGRLLYQQICPACLPYRAKHHNNISTDAEPPWYSGRTWCNVTMVHQAHLGTPCMFANRNRRPTLPNTRTQTRIIVCIDLNQNPAVSQIQIDLPSQSVSGVLSVYQKEQVFTKPSGRFLSIFLVCRLIFLRSLWTVWNARKKKKERKWACRKHFIAVDFDKWLDLWRSFWFLGNDTKANEETQSFE